MSDHASIEERMQPSVDGLRRTVETVTSHGLLVIGSVGRAAIFNALAGNPALEFDERGEGLLVTSEYSYGMNHPRDVDTIGGTIPEQGDVPYWPHIPDSRAFHSTNLQITKDESGAWWMQGRRLTHGDSRIALDPSIFEPVNGTTICGIPCTTVRAVTHLLLLVGRNGHMRAKDETANRLLQGVMPDEDRALLGSKPYQLFRQLLLQA